MILMDETHIFIDQIHLKCPSILNISTESNPHKTTSVMEYLLFTLWISLMILMVGKTIFAYRSLQRTLDKTNSSSI